MKAFVLIWLGGLAVIGLVSVLYPASDTIINPTTYETIVQPFAVPSQPVDVSVVNRVAVQADALAVEVVKVQGESAELAERVQRLEATDAAQADANKALRVYVDEKDEATMADNVAREREWTGRTWVLFAAFVVTWIIACTALIRTLRKGGRVEHK
jgi:hypothetical protein